MILKPIGKQKKFLKLIDTFSKVAEYKNQPMKPEVFLCSNNKFAKIEFKEKKPRLKYRPKGIITQE